jgi:Putative zinc binding domain
VLTNLDAAGCRFRNASLTRTVVDPGVSPLCQTHLDARELHGDETFYPLHVFIREKYLLVQIQQSAAPETIFSEYAYFSSFVDTAPTLPTTLARH